ncbi:serine/threonine-protein kinase [Prosthecobacter sp. SYSU 5D2]|uniref:serine/threonine-protein kinase n=1 Tax=Prosthecobacter sp. SYSU 5D2 TaxID=3134134 RepID=UPI0031FEB62F
MSHANPPATASSDLLIPPTHNALAMLDLALDAGADGLSEGLLEQPGDVIGPYTLGEKLGEGGFGIVWQAEQSEPIRRSVAMKVIRPGMDSLAVLARFRAERRALERMSHPNIAVVLDAGSTPLGRPYFVLELVRGRPITAFCEEAGLDRRQRMRLFLDVCRAVQHAHQRAVLHRDLKPSNILVAKGDDGPVAKIIDFGIAKALTEDSGLAESMACTMRGMVIGTPEYMAPEQAALGGEVVDVRVDVYSLGAILYEMLTGAAPLEPDTAGPKSSLTAMLQRIYEVEPVRPSLRARQRQALGKHSPCKQEELAGDLDWIITRALEKNPERRYDSATALADDIQRHLDDEPVSAGPPDRWYRFQKLVRRNRTAFALGTVIGVNLVMLAGVSTYAFMQESRARRDAQRLQTVAEAQSHKAQALTDYLTRLLSQAGDFVSKGKNPEALRLALNESVHEVENLNADPALQIDLLGRLTEVMMAMGDNRSGLPLVRRQHELAAGLYGEKDPRTLAAGQLMARAYSSIGDKDEAVRIYRSLDQIWKSLGSAYTEQRQETLRFQARELARQGRKREVMDLMRSELVAAPAKDARQKALNFLFVADLQLSIGESEEAEMNLQKALKILPPTDGTRSLLLRSYSRVKAKQKDYVKAASLLEECIQINTSRQGGDQYSLIDRWMEVANHYIKTDRVQDAFRATDEAILISRSQGNDQRLPRALRAAAEIREKAGYLDGALAYRRECMEKERLFNTDRGKWLYELSQIVRLESALGLHADVLRDAELLWEHSQNEPAVTSDPPFMRSICRILTAACEKWQKATGELAFQDDILEWKTITAQGVVQK